MQARHRLVVVGALGVCAALASPVFAQKRPGAEHTAAPAAEPAERPIAGYPVAEARRRAISPVPFDRPLDSATVRRWLEIASQCTIAEFELFLGELSPQEARLRDRVEQTPPPIVNRLYFEHLRGVLKSGGLDSLRIEEQADHGIGHTTPAIENELFGAFECVFASVGPPDGSPRYGDVILRLKDSVREHGWATPFSGMHFIAAIRHQPAAEMQKLLAEGKQLPASPDDPLHLGFDDRLHYSHYIVTEKDWERALAYQAVLVLRNLDDSATSDAVRRRCDEMLDETDPAKFWSLFIPARERGLSHQDAAVRVPFGYLEGKFPNTLTLDDVTSIEVAAERLAEVRSWPESQPYLRLIRVKPTGVE
ncbi:MAG: hypothetical protein R3C10_05060 [Pirellulales bacterium]